MTRPLLSTITAALLFSHAQAQTNSPSDPQLALLEVAASSLTDTLNSVSQSIVAVGHEYEVILAHRSPTPTANQINQWSSRAQTRGKTTEYKTFGSDQPAFQSAWPSFYSYDVELVTLPIRAMQLESLQDVVPVVRAAYNSFDFSWVYITTADNIMLVYPYLTMSEAVNNYPPTEQIFYTCAASLPSGNTGWSTPYLDLVGAGLMVTVSTPVYSHDELAAVASRDITLKQLTASILQPMAQNTKAIAFIVDSQGLAIDSSDVAMNAEIQSVNAAQESAALYYLPKVSLANEQVVSSSFALANKATELVLSSDADTPLQKQVDGHALYAMTIPGVEWRLILLYPISE